VMYDLFPNSPNTSGLYHNIQFRALSVSRIGLDNVVTREYTEMPVAFWLFRMSELDNNSTRSHYVGVIDNRMPSSFPKRPNSLVIMQRITPDVARCGGQSRRGLTEHSVFPERQPLISNIILEKTFSSRSLAEIMFRLLTASPEFFDRIGTIQTSSGFTFS
jgi:hypothetical protein